jgi:hypothetical protein
LRCHGLPHLKSLVLIFDALFVPIALREAWAGFLANGDNAP